MPKLSHRLTGTLLTAATLTLTFGAAAALTPAAADASSLDLRPALLLSHTSSDAAPVAVSASGQNPLSPQQIRSAYSLPATGARDQTIAIVSAYNDPHVAADLKAYDSYFDLPACTTANHCLTIRNEQGKAGPLPENDPSGGTWETEAALGTQTAHGVCGSCKVVLYEADSLSAADLSATVNAAAKAGASVVVTTYEPAESSFDSQYALDYSHAKTAVVSATGEPLDGTYGYSGSVNFPSTLPYVLAIGGTDLSLGRSGGYGSETAWEGTVSGCSLFSQAPSWQAADATAVGCGQMRAVADMAAMSSPGVLVHVSDISTPGGPWYQATGTSLSAPIIAAAIGLAGSLGSHEAPTIYENAERDPAAFHHIDKGATSPSCTSRICEAGPGYNGPTGLGTPDGLAAFLSTGGELTTAHPDITVVAPKGGVKVPRSWKFSLEVRNGLALAVSGTIKLTAKLAGRTKTIATHSITLAPLQSVKQALSVTAADRRALSAARDAEATVALRIRGDRGRTDTVTGVVRLKFPG